jgi:hypothetical protein
MILLSPQMNGHAARLLQTNDVYAIYIAARGGDQ